MAWDNRQLGDQLQAEKAKVKRLEQTVDGLVNSIERIKTDMLKHPEQKDLIIKTASSSSPTLISGAGKVIPIHNDLNGLQGGKILERYHLTEQEYLDALDTVSKLCHGDDETIRLVAALTEDMRVSPLSLPLIGSRPPTPMIIANNGEAPSAGTSYGFNGSSSYARVDDYTAMDSTDLSISIWVKPVTENGDDQHIFYREDYVTIKKSWGDLVVSVNNSWGIYVSNVFTNEAIVHIVVTVNGSRVKIYVNGVLKKNNKVWGLSLGPNSADVYIGSESSSDGFFDGDIDEIHWYNIELTDTQVTELYNEGDGICTVPTGATESTDMIMHFSDTITDISTIGQAAQSGMDTTSVATGDPIVACASGSNGSPGVLGLGFMPGEYNEIYFPAQLSHFWLEGSDIGPHGHWIAPVDAAGKIVFGLEFLWLNHLDPVGNTTILQAAIEPGEFNCHSINGLGQIDGTGKKISSIMACRLYRDGGHTEDTYPHPAIMWEFDFHVLFNSLGSRQPWAK